jgi:hypothetical protein
MSPAKNRRLKTEISCPPKNRQLKKEIATLLSDEELLLFCPEPTVISVAAASQSRTETTPCDEYWRSTTRSQGLHQSRSIISYSFHPVLPKWKRPICSHDNHISCIDCCWTCPRCTYTHVYKLQPPPNCSI